MIYKALSDLIGKTPLLELASYNKNANTKAKIIAKLEYFNPAGSIKDRVAKAIISDAEKKGLINKDTVIIEPTSGNTGIGLVSVAAAKGYKVILTMPETMSIERINLLKAYGAEIILTDGKKGMNGAVKEAIELSSKYENSYIPSQFENPVNPEIHRLTTGPEIWSDTEGSIDFFVAGVGTGGTITGVGEYLKEQNPKIKVIAVQPYDSPLLTGGSPSAHPIQGIGANFIPKILNVKIYDEVISVTGEEAFSTCRKLSQREGLLVGISSGAAMYAATLIAERTENSGKNIIVLFPDTGERYLSVSSLWGR